MLEIFLLVATIAVLYLGQVLLFWILGTLLSMDYNLPEDGHTPMY